MRTVYLRNVPDDVVDRLERLAKRDGMSVNAVAVRELTQSTRRVDNAALFDSLPDLDIDTADIVAALDEGRASR